MRIVLEPYRHLNTMRGVDMQMVILAGGKGTRVQAIASGLPKALLPVAGRPFIDRQFELLVRNGIRDVLLCVGYLGDQIEAHVGDGARWGLRVAYARENPDQLRGTGGALVQALPHLAPAFFVMYGDSYLTADFQAAARSFETRHSRTLMCVFRNSGQWDKSNTRISDGRVVLYSKSAAPGTVDFIDYGLLLFRREVLEKYVDRNPPLDLATIIGECVTAGMLDAFEVPERFYEIGKPSGLAELETYVREHPGE